MSNCGIYKIESIKTGDIYIGGSCHIKERYLLHLSQLRRNKHHSKKLQNHFNKCGESDLCLSIISECDKSNLLEKEQYFLTLLTPRLNMSIIAGSTLGMKTTEEVRDRKAKTEKANKLRRQEHKNNLIITKEDDRTNN